MPIGQILSNTSKYSVNFICFSLTIDANSTLMFNGKTIGVVYFRAGYSPGYFQLKFIFKKMSNTDDYPSEKEWTARLMIERSTAIVRGKDWKFYENSYLLYIEMPLDWLAIGKYEEDSTG